MAESPAQIITIFRNRLREEAETEYSDLAPQMAELARQMVGFVDSKTFVASDGERVTVVTFSNAVSHNAWKNHPEHQQAQQRGIREFYSEYSIQVGVVTYENRFSVEA